MSKKLLLMVVLVVAVLLVSGCATKRDCNGKKLQYNKSGGFWM